MSTEAPPDSVAATQVHQRLGTLTRCLHDALSELGYASQLQQSARELPDAQNRLAYIARLSRESADKVLGCVEQAKQEQDALQKKCLALQELLDQQEAPSPAAWQHFVCNVQVRARRSDALLTDIMLAQNFHDLTGQVMSRVVELVQSLEVQLLQLLLQTQPEARGEAPQVPPRLAGPVLDAQNAPDALVEQSEVDDLLASLGF